MILFATVGPHSRTILKLDRSVGPAGASWKRTKKIPKRREPLSAVLNEVSDHTFSLTTTAQRRHQISNSVYPHQYFFAQVDLRRYIENPSAAALQEAGPLCGLRSGDFRLATRWSSMPEASHVGADGICIFICRDSSNSRDVP
jgi:hypothetical protein